jgi:hypothetical protein
MGLDLGVYKKVNVKRESIQSDFLDFYESYVSGHDPEDITPYYGKSSELYFKYIKGDRIGGYGTYNGFIQSLCKLVYGKEIYLMLPNEIIVGKPFYYLLIKKYGYINYKECELLYYEFLSLEHEYKSIKYNYCFRYQYNKFIQLLRIAKRKNHILIYE